jgi:hypothetical protein
VRKPRDQWGDARLVRWVNEQLGGVFYHRTDLANATSIEQHGLLSGDEAAARGVIPRLPGGSALTRYLDDRSGLTDYVFLSFFKSVLMPRDDKNDWKRRSRILRIDPGILYLRGVAVRLGNTLNSPIYSSMAAVYKMDWEIWEEQDLRSNAIGGKARWNAFLSYEVLVPKCVPLEYIVGIEPE